MSEELIKIAWNSRALQSGTLTPLILFPGIGMILVALIFLAYAVWRKLAWNYLGLGALLWVVALALKFSWAIPVNPRVQSFLNVQSGSPNWLAGLIYYVYIGLLTGVFEVLFTWLFLRYTHFGQATWPQALAFGIGFGAIESFLLGINALATASVALSSASSLPPQILNSLALQNNVLYGLGPVVERFATLFIHISSAVVIFYAINTRQPTWFWLAFIYKTAVDSVAAFAQVWGVNTLARLWLIEAVVVLFGLAGWWGIRWIAKRYPSELPPFEARESLRPSPPAKRKGR